MKMLISNEWNRMIKGKEFWITLFIGCGISVWHFVQNVLPMQNVVNGLPYNAYVAWIGASARAMQSYWFFLILPLLAVIPYAGTVYDDVQSGYYRSIMLRSSRKKYFVSKGIMVILSGGICVSVPLILNFVLTATQLPLLRPDPYIAIGPATSELGCEFFYQHPFAYTMMYLLIDFMAGGMIALAAATLCYMVSHKLLALLLPYVVYYGLYSLCGIFNTHIYAPNFFLLPGMGIEHINTVLLMIAVTVFIFAGYAWKEYKFEG